jgi:hypothetical protein
MSDLTTKKPSYLNSKYNAIKHGILSRKAILEWESREEFDNLCVQLTNQFNPQTPLEKHYLADLINTLWRKQRIIRAEKVLFEVDYNEERIYKLRDKIEAYEYCLSLVNDAENIEQIKDKIIEKLGNVEDLYINSLDNLKIHLENSLRSLKDDLKKQMQNNNNSVSGLNFLSSDQQQKLIRYETHLDKKMERLLGVLE